VRVSEAMICCGVGSADSPAAASAPVSVARGSAAVSCGLSAEAGRGPGARVDDGAGLLGEAVVDRVDQHGRRGRGQCGHAVREGHHPDAPLQAGVAVAFGEGPGVQALGEEGEFAAYPSGGVDRASAERFRLERRPVLRWQHSAGLDDHADVLAGDRTALPRQERGGVVLDEFGGLVDLALHGPVGRAHDTGHFRGYGAQGHVVLAHPRERLRGLRAGQVARAREAAHLRRLRGRDHLLRLLDIGDDRSERGGVRVAETHDAVRMHVLMFAETSDIGRAPCRRI
jgi:hypothetical protein